MKKLIVVVVLLTAVLFSSAAFPLDPQDVNPLDRMFITPHNETLNRISHYTVFLAFLTPAVLFSAPSEEYITIGVMYAETLALTYGTKELLKHLVARERPYMYVPDTPESLYNSKQHNKSFPSGHTAIAFAGATFASYVFSKYNPESEWKIPIIAVSYSLAAATAALRVACGDHFMTDVLTGALVGTAMGIAVPALHTLLADKDITVSASPFALVFSTSY